MLDNMLSLNERMAMLYSITGQGPKRGQLKHLFPRGAFKCKDGYLALNIPDDIMWKRLCKIIDQQELIHDERSKTGTARAEHSNELAPIIENWLKNKTRSEAESLLNENGVPVGSILTAKEVFASEQVKARKGLIEIKDPDVGSFRFARTPIHLSSAPEIPTEPAPDLGEHTNQILSSLLNYSKEKIKDLQKHEII